VTFTLKRRFSDVDVETARLLHHYPPLHQRCPDAELLTDLQDARAGLL
jgi:hypothetical protein